MNWYVPSSQKSSELWKPDLSDPLKPARGRTRTYANCAHLIFDIWLNGEDVGGGVDVPEDDEQDEDVHDCPHHGEARVRPRVVAEIIAPLR